jgi:hypothetical protein
VEGDSQDVTYGRAVDTVRAIADEGLPDRRDTPGDCLAVLGGPEPGPNLGCLADAHSSAVDLGRFVLGQLKPANELAGLQGELS